MFVCVSPKLSLSKKRKFESLQKKLKPKNENNEGCVGFVKWVCSNNEEWKWPHAVICRLSVKWWYAVKYATLWFGATLWNARRPCDLPRPCEMALEWKWPHAVLCRLPWNDAILWSADFPWNDAMLWSANFPWNGAMLWSADFPWNGAMLWRVAPKYYLTSRAKNILFGFRICSPLWARDPSLVLIIVGENNCKH